jgi:uncharacterized membrane protein
MNHNKLLREERMGIIIKIFRALGWGGVLGAIAGGLIGLGIDTLIGGGGSGIIGGGIVIGLIIGMIVRRAVFGKRHSGAILDEVVSVFEDME